MSKKEREIEEKIVKEMLNDAQTKKYTDEVGHKARVERTSVENERTDMLKEVLQDIGKDLEKLGEIPKGMQYVGSAAVHIYSAPVTGTVAYYSQIALASCPEALAGPAFSDLRGAGLEYYSRRRQKKRSGF